VPNISGGRGAKLMRGASQQQSCQARPPRQV
jgi:hypothetical protein